MDSFPLAKPFSKNNDFVIKESKKGVCPRWIFSLPKLSKMITTTFCFVAFSVGLLVTTGLKIEFNSVSLKYFDQYCKIAGFEGILV